jgi:DNA-binding XRE family transcriptional regulator
MTTTITVNAATTTEHDVSLKDGGRYGAIWIAGRKLAKLRMAAGFSQHALAKASGVGRDRIAHLEMSEWSATRPVTARKLCDACGIQLRQITGFK